MNTNIEIANMLLACEDLKTSYDNYKHHLSLFPKLMVSLAQFPTKQSPNAIKSFQDESNQMLSNIQTKALELQKIGLESELIGKILNLKEH